MGVGMSAIPMASVHAASILAGQEDGSISASGTVFDQVFISSRSAKLGAIEISTFGFGTGSRNPDTNGCSLSLYDDEAGAFIASADGGFSGFGCGGDLVFTFHTAEPLLAAGHRYRWEYRLVGFQAGVSIYGSGNDTVHGSFNVPPVVNAKFTAYAVIDPPISLVQSNDSGAIAEGGITASRAVLMGAVLPSASLDSLQLQVELEPSFIAFKGQPNFTGPFVDSGSPTSVATSGLAAGGYHWQARSVDAQGNASSWSVFGDPSVDPDFVARDPSSEILLEDTFTTYSIGTVPNPCFGDGTLFSCAMSPTFYHYTTASSFPISKITLDWQNGGSNNCDGVGNYGAIITSALAANTVIATSTNTIYMGCAPGSGPGSGTFDFSGETIPSSFYLTFGAFDGGLQGGSGILLTHVTVHTAPPLSADPKREPVVIVPGIFGSVYKNGKWILQPTFQPYDTLKSTLVANGYVEGQTLFEFPYDWEHETIPAIARKFADKVKEIKALCDCKKINAIAHSMGGLVVRQYVESDLYDGGIDQLVFLGVPQLGSPLAYLAWEGGTTLFSSQLDLFAVLEKAFMRGEAIEAGYAATPANPDLQIYRYIHASSSPVYAFQELLPIYDYLRDARGGSLRQYPNGYPVNDFLENLNASTSLAAFRGSGIHVVNFYSEDQADTVDALDVRVGHEKLPLWADGVPMKVERGAGDNTVPSNSAKAIEVEEAVAIGGTHLDLPTAAAEKIVGLLGGISDPVTVPKPSIIKKYLSIFALSPVDILVTAPDGSMIGKDPSSGEEVGQIGGAFYSGADSANEYVAIPNPSDGRYVISVQGTATGTYHIMASYGYVDASSATSSDAIFKGDTQPGLVDDLSVTVEARPRGGKQVVLTDVRKRNNGRQGDRDRHDDRRDHDCYNESDHLNKHEKISD